MTLSNLTSGASGEASVSSGARGDASTVALSSGGGGGGQATSAATIPPGSTPTTTTNSSASGQLVAKRKRNLPGTPDPDAEVIALSPKTLMATNRFVCEICNKGFQRDQNLQLHRRGHNLPWKLRQRTSKEIRKRVYICPEPSCVHHDPARALGDLTGIKKHFCRKHGEKKWKCEKCSKRYAVHSDWKAHSKTCGTREYRCDCGTLFSRRDSFITHRAFCDALAEESARVSANRPGQGPGGGEYGGLGAGPSGGGTMSVMGAPSSPRSANAAAMRGTVGQMDPLSVNAPPPAPGRLGMGGNLSSIGMGEGGNLSILPGRWAQHQGTQGGGAPGSGGPGTPGSRTRLSLWSGPGPGPPPLMGSSQLTLGGGNSQVNTMDSSSPFLMQQSGILEQRGPNVSNIMGVGGGAADFDLPQASRSSGGMIQMPFPQGSMFANLFAPGNGLPGIQGSSGGPGQTGGNLGMAGITSGFADFGAGGGGAGGGAANRFERGGLGAQGLSLSSAAGMPSSTASSSDGGAGGSGAGGVPSILNQQQQQQHTSTAQMSATALLQKAAQMSGPLSSDSNSLLRGFGMGGGPGGSGHGSQGGGGNDNSSIALGTLWQGPNRQDQGRAASLPPISSAMSGLHNNMIRRPGDPSPGSQSMGSSLQSAAFGSGRQQQQSDHQDFMNSLAQQFTPSSVSNIPAMYQGPLNTGSANMGGMIPPNSSMKQHRLPQGNDNLGGPQQQQQQHQHQQQHQQHQQQQHHQPHRLQQQQQQLGGSQGPQGIPPMPALPKSEDGRDRLTRDFLGVGATTASMPVRTVSQMDFHGNAGMSPLAQGRVMDISYTNQQQRSVGASGQPSPGKSWDGS